MTTSPLVAALRPTTPGAQVRRKERPGGSGTGAQVTGIGAQVRRNGRPGPLGTGAQVAPEPVPEYGRNTHPAGEVEPFEPGETVEFDPEACGACPLRAKCTQAASGHGRTVSIATDEARQRKYRKLQKTGSGRAMLRRRTAVEHALAHIAARKGLRARYVGVRRNLFDLRRAATIQNLESIHRLARAA